MAIASDQEESMMAALIGVGSQQAEEVVAVRRSEGGKLWVANCDQNNIKVSANNTCTLGASWQPRNY